MHYVNIYTDGACAGNQHDTNKGGWGAILEFGTHQKELYGGQWNTTNNRMEMMALLKALQALKKKNLPLRVFSDSSYLVECFRKKWYTNWLKNGWKTSAKQPVENRDLWESLLPFLHNHTIDFYRVKGHLNLDHPNTDKQHHFAKFQEWNGTEFSFDDFSYIVKKNHRADALANLGMDTLLKE